MTENNFNDIYCSRNCQNFILLFDGLGTYYLYYKDELLKEITEPELPKKLYNDNKTKLLVGTAKFKAEEQNPLIKEVFGYILNIIGTDNKLRYKVMTVLKDLFRTLSDAETDIIKNMEHFTNAPQMVLDKAIDISTLAGNEVDIFNELLSPKSIEEEIQQREKPILTQKEKEIVRNVEKQIKEIGLLPYLNNILDAIQLGSHKNIFRKILAGYNIISGKGSYLSETTAKAEQGKTFEDEIVFLRIIPQNYIFEVNEITLASFVRYALINPKYFSRMIIYFGDLGAKKSFLKVEDIFNVVKPLITENKYKYIKSDKENNTGIIEQIFKVDSIGSAYQTTKNSFTEDDDQLISRTIFSTPANVEPKEIAEKIFYEFDERTKQSRDKADAEQKLNNFGLFLVSMVNTDIKVINPYFDVFWEYASKSDNPIREMKQQMELFNAYCILTNDKCKKEPYNTLFASEEQLKEFMDYINLENALIPYEYDFLNMLLAKGKAKELEILYNDYDINDEKGDLKEDIEITEITTLTECENTVIEQMNEKIRNKLENYDENYDRINSKSDLNNQQTKEMPQKLLSNFGFRSTTASKRIFFRKKDIDNYYGKRRPYKNIDDVNQLLQTLYHKGYLGKYEEKQGKENLYYLTPECNNLTSDFKLKKSYDRYVTDYFMNTGINNF